MLHLSPALSATRLPCMIVENSHQLVFYKAAYWDWWGLKDRSGRLSLNHLTRDGEGVAAEPERCRIVEGDEYTRQMEAIEWFRMGGNDEG